MAWDIYFPEHLLLVHIIGIDITKTEICGDFIPPIDAIDVMQARTGPDLCENIRGRVGLGIDLSWVIASSGSQPACGFRDCRGR